MSAQLAKASNLARQRHANFSRKESRRTTAKGIACMTQQEPGRNQKPNGADKPAAADLTRNLPRVLTPSCRNCSVICVRMFVIPRGGEESSISTVR
jgi:hypothetical protein